MSTRSALTVVGAVVGMYFGYPQLGLVVGGLVGSAVDPATIQGPAINEVAVQTQAEGVPRIIPYGTVSCVGNVIQNGPLIKTTEYSSQGKGGSSVETPTAYRTFAIGICEGPIAGMLRVWEDNTLVYDVRPGSLMLAESAKWMQNKFLHTGEESQDVDPFLEFIDPETPAYRGTAYLTFVLENQTDRGGSFKQYRFEVAALTNTSEILGPLVVNPWAADDSGVPVHDQASTQWTISGGGTYTVFATAASAAAAAASVSVPSAAYATNYVSFTSSISSLDSLFTGGATLISSPQTLTYKLAVRAPDVIENPPVADGPYTACSPLQLLGATPDDGKLFALRSASDALTLATLLSYPIPTTGAYTISINNCINYPMGGGGNYPVAVRAPYVEIVGTRIPSPPPGWSEVAGTAKQLCAVEYRSGALYQNALGPVLLPGDPNYSDAAYWESARAAAISAGLMHADVAYPATVSSYAVGGSTVAGEPVQLGIIVSDIHQRCGIDGSLFNTAELTALVDGFSIAGPYTGADGINALRAIHMFDKSDHDGKLWYPRRGKAVVKTLTIDDLTEVPDTSQREQAGEIPYKLNLTYQHAASGYAPVKATAPGTPSPDRRTTGEVSMSTALVLNENAAAQAADKIYKITLAEANGTVEIAVPLAVAADLADADCIGLSLRGRVSRLRIEQSAFTDWTVKFTLKSDRQSAYTSEVTGIPIPPPTLPPSTIVGDTELAILDLPARTDTEDDLSYLVAVSAALPPWYGAQLQRSLDAGATWTNVQQLAAASVMGVLTANVAAASAHYTDTVNAVKVQLYRSTQTLDNLTDMQFLSEQGAFALENADGSWEVLQYRDAHVEVDGSITLTTLHRGLLNSGGSAHAPGARLVLLSTATHIAASASWLGLNMTSRAISLGESADDTDNDATLAFAGKSQIEYPVTYLSVARDLSNVLRGSWVPRPRFGSDVNPIQSTNLLGYRVTVVGSSTVTFDVPSASFTYDASALGASVTVSVSALNRITGPGPAVSTTA